MANAIMDLVLMGLLLAALTFGVRLDRRLKALRAGQEAFAQAVRDLDDAAIRAHNSLKELRANADESQELLHGRVIAAREALKRLEGQIARAERAGIDIDKSLANWETMSALRAAPARPGPSIAPVADAEAPRPFRHDVVRSSASSQPVPPSARRSQLPPAPQTDDADMLDKVQMSELVVANLNEMIRSLNHPGAQRRRMPTVLDDELFGDNEKR